jgi:putative tricarboxylic transport membrane protein
MSGSGPEPEPRGPDRAALVIALGLAGLAAMIAWQTARMPVTVQYARIGPTAFPYAVAAGLAALAVATGVSAWRGRFPARDADEVAPMLWIIGGLAAQMLTLKLAGFSIATGLLFALAARGFGRGPLWMTLPIGIGFAFVLWLIFARGLQLSLPMGPLESLFF